ncbi:MAG TPA: RNA-binding protein [Polyangiaceae bacterium]|jgi:RNA recognition motif-containing protein|nr:RNA-binding protein [Polyangiaceae bacterium]
MSNRVFVGGLSWDTDEASLRRAFDVFGELTDAKIVTDRETGRSRGFGFISFADETAAANAIAKMDGTELDGRAIRVNLAHERTPRGGGGGGGGGFERRGGGGGGGGRDRRGGGGRGGGRW